MSPSMMISSMLQMLLGLALLVLWRIDPDPRYHYVRLWGWSAVLLGLGLMLGIALVPAEGLNTARRDLQGGLASFALMLSMYLQMKGTRLFRHQAWNSRAWAGVLLTSMLLIALLAHQELRWAVIAAAAALALGNWACALWMAGGEGKGERIVAICFAAMGCVNASGPLLDPLSRSPITHGAGLLTQSAISLGLILLAVARAH
ncbi:MAG TPA: hypothetical protein VJN44_02965, partial [Roseateles sp.]|nr:hypothetical protein [Roseateles sp.]